MKSWEELKKAGIEEAASVLASRTDAVKLRDLFVEWIDATRNAKRSTRAEINAHPSTTTLADALQAAGLDDACDYVRSFADEVGAIHAGQWLFAILLGRACASDLASALAAGEWRDVPFWGHEQFGAWEAFEKEVLWILEHDSGAQEGAWRVVAEIIDEAKRDPGRFSSGNSEERAGILARVETYVAKPTIEEAWETRLDSQILFDRSFIFGVLRKLDAKRFLMEAEKLRHPVFFDPLLNGPDAVDEQEIGRLIAEAPVAFDQEGAFQNAGMIVVRLLREASARIRHLGGSGHVYPLPLCPDNEAQMRTNAESATAAADVVLDAIFSRTDAIFLAWAWLERLIFEGEHRGFWRSDRRQGKGASVDALILTIAAIAQRLAPRDNPEAWVFGEEPLRRIYRAVALLAATVFGRESNSGSIERVLRLVLLPAEPYYHGAREAIARSDSLLGRIGGRCILAVHRPSEFVATVWQQLRPLRERSWGSVLQGEAKTNLGELLALWSIFALENASADVQPPLVCETQKILRDAFQTDAQADHGVFWPAAIERFCRSFAKTCSGMPNETDRRLVDLIRPYLRAEDDFIHLVVSLNVSGIDAAILHRVVASLGPNLPDLVDEFLATRHRLIARGHYDNSWLERVRSLSGSGEKPNAVEH